ncbi:MAG: type IV-A pilus assembly ATPase PilB [Candidatus Mcinerneyibacterium aminivorans]|uniref:protein-secreting ATPase n=1 Tax=Candidatus Mcinerneyibacterium aminivorans TaxID=2703815 RepID=A0A5D0MET8_9BACT|nr:MAG: type IV-A pilus assembly ATPase PilB [Candidatus Mcinerneyibacterium aminivorans]
MKIGEILIEEGIITEKQLKKALKEQKSTNEHLGTILVRMGYVSESVLTNMLGKQMDVASVDLTNFEIDENILREIPEEIARKYNVIPLHRMGHTITVAMVDPTNVMAIDDIKFHTGYNIEPVVSAEASIKKAINKYYGSLEEETNDIDEMSASFTDVDLTEFEVVDEEEEENINQQELMNQVEDEPIVKLVRKIIVKAVVQNASDVHIEPYEKSLRVRYRIDGMLQTVLEPPKKLQYAISSRIKILAKLDIAEKRIPQDGRVKMKVSRNKYVDLRVSILPTVFGEKIVMRILDKDNLMLDMADLGFAENELRKFRKAIQAPYGIILVTGPTGSGKTTTLYSALHQLNDESVNIMTAEDPVEFNLQGINQVNVKSEIGLTFAASLRSFLRQDPDIILVGEMRDYETAEIGIKAALTGHLVLSTLHTNDAPSSVNRLVNMGVEPFLIASSVVLIMAQRLIRTLCGNCKEQYNPTEAELKTIGIDPSESDQHTFFRPKGCENCNNTGYKGRAGVFEVLYITDKIRKIILNRGSSLDIKEVAREEGMRTLRESAVEKFKNGSTSYEEVIEKTFED